METNVTGGKILAITFLPPLFHFKRGAGLGSFLISKTGWGKVV
jgi:hypothetical protein